MRVVKQDGNTKDMIFGLPELIEYISKHMTLEEGDLILTGTPAGVGQVKPGQKSAARSLPTARWWHAPPSRWRRGWPSCEQSNEGAA